MSAEDFAPGKWDLEKSENFDEYMKALGVGMAMRLIGNKAKPRQEISIKDGEWTITTSTALNKVEIKFKPGQPFEEKTADGRNVQTTCTVSGNKLISDQKGSVDSKIIRDFNKDSFVMTLTANNVECKRYYKKAD
ncbi:fatty acid-binding protein muscle [Biomphalaria glabrata]|uniref:Sodium/calcium exchanger regulatory protein 1-like n=1 Tax=Biomphalaria glabrata TaxID=6526 RepID=A0A2C9JLQ9_BIOGL|nr:sodium/calcium exchanger regulatory protein 1-like [Biomphalaria glabrata]KAI8749083.1 fatty acid-binding protein, muscle [Biomphalaria glabrata]KAI8753639.1 fatty acid-binding protein; muscle-like [Biomphalaria glabrata]